MQTTFAELPNSKNNGGQLHHTRLQVNQTNKSGVASDSPTLNCTDQCTAEEEKKQERFTFFVVRSGFAETDSEIRHRAFSVLF